MRDLLQRSSWVEILVLIVRVIIIIIIIIIREQKEWLITKLMLNKITDKP